jgi:hypothetical protein
VACQVAGLHHPCVTFHDHASQPLADRRATATPVCRGSQSFVAAQHRDLPNIGEWGSDYVQKSTYVIDPTTTCLLCRQAKDKLSHLYMECPMTLKILKLSPLKDVIDLPTQISITITNWIQWFTLSQTNTQLVKFVRAIYEMNHNYQYSVPYKNPEKERNIMQDYVNHCVTHQHEDFKAFHRRYHLDDP